ncbi:MAG: hypothetical protein ACI8VL_002133 [Bacteroidia bacterium]|jgi:hypothetical protein
MKVQSLIKPLNILSRSYKLEDLMRENEVLMVRAEDFNADECDKVLSEAEANILSILGEKKLKKRIFYILVESMQNITRHKAADHVPSDGTIPLLIIGKHGNKPYILTANPIENSNISYLQERIDTINSTGVGELRQLYRETLNERKFSDAGGANLGLIDIARKAGGELQYGFDTIDDKHSYFILKININAEV